jgi:hypothetical protein
MADIIWQLAKENGSLEVDRGWPMIAFKGSQDSSSSTKSLEIPVQTGTFVNHYGDPLHS